MAKLTGVHAKLDRADALIESLRAQLYEIMGGPSGENFAVAARYETYDGLPAVTLFAEKVPVFPASTSIYIGEIVHDLRSALDNLAWSMVPYSLRRNLKPGASRQVEFPMAHSATEFQAWIGRRIPGSTVGQQQVINQYQPFRRTDQGRAIRTLQTLSNTDKHRRIVPALLYPIRAQVGISFEDAGQIGEAIQRIPGRTLMYPGTPLVTWLFTSRPRNVKVSMNIANTPGFRRGLIRPSPGNDFEDVSGTLTTIATCCKQVVSEIVNHG
jgi:hypothetical protein